MDTAVQTDDSALEDSCMHRQCPYKGKEEQMDWGRFEIDDNMDDDPDYTPDQEDLNEEELTIRMEADVNPVLENKYLVAHSCLVQLFTQCREPQCQYSTDPILRTRETLVTVTTECTDGHLYSWSSQPSDETLPWGNLSVAAAVLYSGSSYKKMATFFSHMKVPFISSSTFYKIQRSYLTPVVIEYWRGWQDVYLEMLEGKEVSVAGDGRCDSPGHCAKYCSYSIMDVENNKVLDTQIVQVQRSFSLHLVLVPVKYTMS